MTNSDTTAPAESTRQSASNPTPQASGLAPADEQSPSAFCRTPTATAIWNSLKYAQRRASLAAVVGPGGIGKTTTVYAYAAANPKVHVFQASIRTRTANRLIDAMVDRFFSGTRAMAENELFRFIRHEPGSLLIIDEAQYLFDGAVELLRYLNDSGRSAKWNGFDWSGFIVGIVLVGNTTVVSQREGKNRFLNSQFLTRLRPRLILGASLAEDYEVLFDHYKIAGVANRKRIQATTDRMHGGLRTATFVIERAQEIAGDQPVTRDHIEEAIAFLGYQ